ncbi:MAG: DUF3307 domain-containing protein [Mariniphaga sp.]
MIVLVKLILAHLLGDFLLQPDSWVKAKEQKKLAAWQLYGHSLIHFALIMLLVFDITFWKWGLLLAMIHLLIDMIKVYTITVETKRQYFYLDQFIHFVCIFTIWLIYQDHSLFLQKLPYEHILLLFTGVYALTTPTSLAIKVFISKWTPHTVSDETESLQEAGKYIGILERLFVFAFVISGHWEAIGFMLAAKSIFRFGDLKDSKDRKLTEYVLIGTMISFGTAIVIGVIIQKLLPIITN